MCLCAKIPPVFSYGIIQAARRTKPAQDVDNLTQRIDPFTADCFICMDKTVVHVPATSGECVSSLCWSDCQSGAWGPIRGP